MNARMKLAGSSAMALALVLTGMSVSAQETAVMAVPVSLDMTGEGGAAGTYLGRIVIGYDAEGAPIYAADNRSTLEGRAVTGVAGMVRLDDILRQTPGVTTRLDVGQPAAAVAIRGLQGHGRVEMNVEGVPQNFRLLGHAAEGYAYLDQAMLSSVTVNRGASVVNGGLGGAVDFRMIGFDDVLRNNGQGGLVRLSYGENGGAFTGVSAYAQELGAARFLAAFSGKVSENYENGEGEEVRYSAAQSNSILLRGGYDLSDSTSLAATYYGYMPEFESASYEQEVMAQTMSLGLTHQTSDLIDLSANIYRSETDVEYGTYVGTSPMGGGFVGRQMRTTTTGIDVTNTSIVSLGAWDIKSINGLEISTDELGGVAGGTNPTNGTVTRSALFSNNIFTNGALELSFGLRANHYDADAIKRGEQVTSSDSTIDPKISIAYQVNDWLQPYLSANRTMRAPALQELVPGEYGGHDGFTLDYLANTDLRPETAQGYEAGVNIRHNNVSARLAYFQIDAEDYISQLQTGNYHSGIVVQFVNIDGTTRTSGIELEASYDTEVMSAVVSYNKAWSDIPGAEKHHLQAPESFALTVARHFMDGVLSLGGTYSYTSAGRAFSSAGAQTSSYGLVDVFANYAVNENMNLSMKLTNAFDETYTAWGSAAVNATGSAQGQNLFLGAEFRF